jgi:hypothetical protein
MDPETRPTGVQYPSQDELASVKVFPLIVQFKKDAIVRELSSARGPC